MKRLLIYIFFFGILLFTETRLQAQFSSTPIYIKSGTGFSYSSIDYADYDRDGDLDLAVMGQNQAAQRRAMIFINNGNGTFKTNTHNLYPSYGLWGMYQGDLAWVDYNNDEYPDLVITGADPGGNRYCFLFENLRNGQMSDPPRFIINNWGLDGASINIADYDNDGYQDLALTGTQNGGLPGYLRIFRNNSIGDFDVNFIDPKSGWGVYNGDLVSADFDKDGDIDIAVAGNDGAPRFRIYYNNGNGTFATNTHNIEFDFGFYYCSLVKGDFDRDGDIDIIISGDTQNYGYRFYLYHNKGNGTFHQDEIDIGSDWGVIYCSLDTGDYDLDGDLDLAVAGATPSGADIFRIYYNNGQGIFDHYENVSPGFVFRYGCIRSLDYDNDGDLDLVVSGYKNAVGTYYFCLFRNDVKAPEQPAGPAAENKVRILPNYLGRDAENAVIYFTKADAPDEEFQVVITTLSGLLVRDLGKFTTAELEKGICWNLENENNTKVLSGIYFVSVTGKSDTVVKKLYISR